MKRLRGFEDRESYRGGFLSIGNFDGVHRGHQSILARLRERADQAGVPAVVMTFDPHPITLLNPQFAPPRLTTSAAKAALMAAAGVDVVVEYPTDAALLNLTAAEFFEQVVLKEFEARGLVEGPNFFFGKGREGTVERLAGFCEQAGRSLDVVGVLESGGETVSSSAIRGELKEGNVPQAARLLGRYYRLEGVVASGAGRGRTLGFPTANLQDVQTLIPGEGVYACWATWGEERFQAAVHVGGNPTFAEQAPKIEVHLLSFEGDLYGEALQVEFVERVRELRSFQSPAELQHQVQQDVRAVPGLLAGAGRG